MKVFFIDLETTGTNPLKHAIIEFAGVVYINGEFKDKIEERLTVHPDREVDPEALKVSGLNPDNHEITSEQFFRRLVDFMAKYVNRYNKDDKFYFMGYGARFDSDFMREFWELNNDKYYGAWFHSIPVDIMNIVQWYCMVSRKRPENMKLSTVYKWVIGTDLEDAHDAMVDIKASIFIYQEIIKELTNIFGKKYMDTMASNQMVSEVCEDEGLSNEENQRNYQEAN